MKQVTNRVHYYCLDFYIPFIHKCKLYWTVLNRYYTFFTNQPNTKSNSIQSGYQLLCFYYLSMSFFAFTFLSSFFLRSMWINIENPPCNIYTHNFVCTVYKAIHIGFYINYTHYVRRCQRATTKCQTIQKCLGYKAPKMYSRKASVLASVFGKWLFVFVCGCARVRVRTCVCMNALHRCYSL